MGTPEQTECNSALDLKKLSKCHTCLERSKEDAFNRPKNAPFGLGSQKIWLFKVEGVPMALGHLRARREGFPRNPSTKYGMWHIIGKL